MIGLHNSNLTFIVQPSAVAEQQSDASVGTVYEPWSKHDMPAIAPAPPMTNGRR
jgi:hypothetical protein